MRCSNGKHGFPLTVSSALTEIHEEFIEFTRPAVERHGIEPGVRPHLVIWDGPSDAHHGLVLNGASSGPYGIRPCFHKELSGSGVSSIVWSLPAVERLAVFHHHLPRAGNAAELK